MPDHNMLANNIKECNTLEHLGAYFHQLLTVSKIEHT